MLVYTHQDAWKDIYGHQNGATIKGEELGKEYYFYRSRNVPPNILSESRENHGLIRRQLSHGFSDKSLRAQEPIIKGYVDLFIQRLKERCVPGADGSATTEFDMRHWFNYATFDIIGDLAFGEPFGCLEKGQSDPRVAFLEKGLSTANTTYFVKELGLERFLMLVAMRVANFRKVLVQQMSQILERRLSMTTERLDLIEGLIKKKDDWVSRSMKSLINFTWSHPKPKHESLTWVEHIIRQAEDQCHASVGFLVSLSNKIRFQGSLLWRTTLTCVDSIIAGSETTATLLTGTTFLLLKNPATLQKLNDEIRSAFKSEDEITFSSVEHLPYST